MTSLATLIFAVESNRNKYALRFEPHVYRRASEGGYAEAVEQARKANRCSRATAAVIVATSWGMPQVMGFNLYGKVLDFKLSIGEFLNSEAYQEWALKAFLKSTGFDADDDVGTWDEPKFLSFATKYNGPGAPREYVKRMKQVLETL